MSKWRRSSEPTTGTYSAYVPYADRLYVSQLACYGCAHAACDEPFPGQPSGERPCHFCVRNRELEDPPVVTKWYDQSDPVRIPMDCYTTMDMRDQYARWLKDAAGPTLEERTAAADRLAENLERLQDGV